DDLGQPALLLGEMRRFGEQLPGVAHGAHGVANLVGDAGAQASEGRELGLLDLLGDEARVLEKNQHRRRARGAERGEVRPDHPPAVGGYEGWIPGRRRSAAPTTLTPGLE